MKLSIEIDTDKIGWVEEDFFSRFSSFVTMLSIEHEKESNSEDEDEIDLDYATDLVLKKYKEFKLDAGMENAGMRSTFNTFVHKMCDRIGGVSIPEQLDHDQLVIFCKDLKTIKFTADGKDFEIGYRF